MKAPGCDSTETAARATVGSKLTSSDLDTTATAGAGHAKDFGWTVDSHQFSLLPLILIEMVMPKIVLQLDNQLDKLL